jgi:hypothetical protein
MVLHLFLTKFDEERWVQNFHMTKPILIDISNQLRPIIMKTHTKYRKIVLVEI